MTHLNAFIGRYSTKRHRRSVERTTGWDVKGNFLEKIPILALRNRDMENESPLSWRSDRNLRHAISLTLDRLKAWQAFRPLNSDKIVRKVKIDLPDIIKNLQRQLRKYYVGSLWDIMDLEQNDYKETRLRCFGRSGVGVHSGMIY
jgi:hypothetical protein